MTLEQLLHGLRTSGFFDPDHLLDAIAEKTAIALPWTLVARAEVQLEDDSDNLYILPIALRP